MVDTDEIIYNRYLRERSEDDLRILLERHRDSLVLFLFSFIHDMDDAEELMLDSYADIAAGSRFSGKSSFKTWLFSIGKHKALMYLRKKKVYLELEEDIEDEVSVPPELTVLGKERNLELYRAMEKIKDEYRQVLILLFFEEMSVEETARVMGKTRKQIYNLYERGKKSLKDELERTGFSYDSFL